MNIARFSVTRPVAVTMRIAALVLLGAICFFRLPVDLLPDVSLPTVAVNTTWPNVAAPEIETQVTRAIERAVTSVPGVYEVTSSTEEGRSFVRVQFNYGVNMDQAAVDVLQQVERARRTFPNDPTLERPTVFKFDPSQSPIQVWGVSGEQDPIRLYTLLDQYVAPMIEKANGVAAVTVAGGQERAIIVEVDPRRLQAYNLSLPQITRRLQQENQNLPAGVARESNTEYTIRSLGWFQSVEEIGALPIGVGNGRTIALRDVATIRDAAEERRIFTRLNGEEAVGLIITKQSGANTVSTAAAVQEQIEAAKRQYPHLNFGLAYDQSKFIENSVKNLEHHAIIGGVLAVLILLFFLRNIRSTLVVALSIPISIISTFALLYVCGFSLNVMSLGGLALATGLIVDDAVVVLENIFRHMERDKKRSAEAAVSGTQEILSAVVASTFTVMVVFLPLLLIQGQAGQMFLQFALVVIFSMLVSLLDATTVVPMLSSRLIKGETHSENLEDGRKKSLLERMFARFGVWFDALDRGYRNGLVWAIKRRALVLAGAVGITAASFLLWPFVGSELWPQADSGDFNVNVRMPVGTSVDVTNETMLQVEQIVRGHPAVQTAFAAAGTNLSIRGIGTNSVSNVGAVMVKLKPDRRQSTQEVIADLRRQLGRLPGARARASQVDVVSNIISGGNQNLEINIFGDDLAELSRISRELMAQLRDVRGLENLDVNWQETSPELQWTIDRQKALQLGVTFPDVAGTLNTATNGSIASYYQEGGFQYPILVQLPQADRQSVESLSALPITPSLAAPGSEARQIRMDQVATATRAIGPSEITRIDRRRYIAVTGTPEGRPVSEIQADVEKVLAGYQMPQNYTWDWGTSQKRRAEEFAGMGLAVFLAIALIYMLLASQFESFIHPLTVLTAVPLSAVGVILAMFLTGRSFGLTAFVGVLLLVGIVVRNSIILVDYTNILRGRGMKRDEAILTAGPTRLRPILMTTGATVFGMLPIAIGFGEGSETQVPMATAVIGGLLTSTALTLFVVPVIYTLFDDLGKRFRKDERDLSQAELVTPTIEAIERTPADANPSTLPTKGD